MNNENKITRLSERAKMSIMLWASNNRGKLEGKTLTEMREVVEQAAGVKLPDSAARLVCDTLGIKPKQDSHALNSLSGTRKLANVVRDLMTQLGVEIPDDLEDLCE